MTATKQLAQQLNETDYHGATFQCLVIAGAKPVLRVEVSDHDTLPIFITQTDTQLLCIAYLAHESEIISDKKDELNQLLLELNVPMPLSAFARVEGYYVLFGALAAQSPLDFVTKEIVTLAENSEQVIASFEEFLG